MTTETEQPVLACKTSFDGVYGKLDPRAYFRTLAPLSYQIPQQAQGVFRRLVRTLRGHGHEARVVDLACSYGVNGALLNHDLMLEEMYDRYSSADVAELSTDELVVRDRAFYAHRRRDDAAPVVGVDVSKNAVGYAEEVGLLEAGLSDNLEIDDPSAALKHAVAGTTLVTVTGGIGYITSTTFDRLLGAVSGRSPWVAAFALRAVPFAPIARVLRRYGLAVERWEQCTFPQRRFADEREQEAALDDLARAGIDAEGREADGYYHTVLYVARPPADAAEQPLEEVLEGVA